MSAKCPPRVLSLLARKWDNMDMEQLLQILSEIGLPDYEVRRVGEYYRDDETGLRSYVLYMRAMMDDRHEYVD